jgi:hypothetical protein
MPAERPGTPLTIKWSDPTWSPGDVVDPVGTRGIRVCDTAIRVIDRQTVARHHGSGDALDGHALVTRLKVAVGLALLNGHADVRDEDWGLAGQGMTVSDAMRQYVIGVLANKQQATNHARAKAEAERAIMAEQHTDEYHIRRVTQWLIKRLRDQGD